MKRRILLPLLLIPFGLFISTSCSKAEIEDSDILKYIKFKYDTKNNTASVNGLKDSEYINVVIPEKITKKNVEYTVTSIEDNAFNSGTTIESIVLPDTITEIGEQAFFKCTSLRSIDLGNGVTKIGTYAFSQCKALVNIDLPNSLTSLPFGAFNQCTSLWSIDLPDTITTLPGKAFYGASQLTYITAKSLTKIGDSAFEVCSNFKYAYFSEGEVSDVVIGTNNSIYESSTKNYNADLTKGEIFNKYNFAFNPANNTCDFSSTKDKNITNIDDLPQRIQYLGMEFLVDGIYKYALYKSNVETITLPESVITVGDYAFANSKIKSFDSNKVTQIGKYAFQNCSNLETITLNDEVSTIMTYAFQNCTKLTSVILPLNIMTLQKGLFSGCSQLSDVTIQNNITKIYELVFENCSSLSVIHYTDTLKKWDSITKDSDSAEILGAIIVECIVDEQQS